MIKIKKTISCLYCEGYGKVDKDKFNPNTGHYQIIEDCDRCNGNGFVDCSKRYD